MTWKRGLATDDWVGLITGKGRLAYIERVGLMTGGGVVGWGLHLVIGWEIKISREDFGLKLVISFHILNLEKDK